MPPTKRPTCPACARPTATCTCRWIAPTPTQVELLILQHPLEAANAKNTAGLLHRCLPRSRLAIGESFTNAEWLAAPWRDDADAAPRRLVLLYPQTPLDQAADLAAPPPLDTAWLAAPERLRLVLLDGTWRKSRKMLYASPALQRLPRLALCGLPASRYLIRKARRPDQLSTLEAACAALVQLEGEAVDVGPLLAAFDGFVAQQAAYRTG